MVIEEASEAKPELLDAMAGLVRQLSQSAPPLTATELAEIVDSPATRLLIARNAPGGEVIGSLTLALFRIPTGMRAWIEDVVVAESSRGQGTGQALIEAAIEAARAAGCRTVDLTSRPSREAANGLYRKVGFTPRATNVYRMELDSP